MWTAAGRDPAEPLPLLVVHDGPEYAEYSLLLQLLESATAELEIPPLRAALLPPPFPRDEHYSASAHYARALALDLLPALRRRAPSHGSAPVGLGASLGALALLHAHRVQPGAFGGLLLQSGSFFRLRSDRQEAGFARFGRIARFVGSVLRAPGWPDPIPVGMTCGTGEENLANNRVVRDALARQGYAAELDEHPDAHNWVSWRDSLHGPLVSLLQRLWG
ncbi:MAG: enterochelin esterase [Thermoleophilia bacterium]|nr:enterochelin esterase [Thermoleophilia bacterium]